MVNYSYWQENDRKNLNILRVLERKMVRSRCGSMSIPSANFRLDTIISIGNQIIIYGQLSKPSLQPCLGPVPWTLDHGTGLLEPFSLQFWISFWSQGLKTRGLRLWSLLISTVNPFHLSFIYNILHQKSWSAVVYLRLKRYVIDA